MPAAMTEVIPKSPQIAIRWVCTSPLVVAPQMKKVPKRIQKVSDRETRSEEHTSELQSLMRISYAVFCLKKKNIKHHPKINVKNKMNKNKEQKRIKDQTSQTT